MKRIKDAKTLDPQMLFPIRNMLWEDEKLLDEYLFCCKSSLSTSEEDIINSWKRRVSKGFIILKHLEKYTVFMSGEDNGRLYGVIFLLCEIPVRNVGRLFFGHFVYS
ncbi:MAG: hypothetical protein GX434_10185 [Peptococcaceae bacterium]|nr:hypothetical protein [Peptococcaceae bacterium]